MQAITALKSFFRPSDVTVALPEDPFVMIGREKAIEKLNLDERAEENGSKNYPPATAVGFDDVESKISAEMAELVNRAQINAQANHVTYAQRLSELSLLRELSSITGASAQTLGDFSATVIDNQNRLANARDAIKESFQELAEFKRVHNRSGPAQKGISTLVGYSTFLITGLAEAAVGTGFLGVNDDLGLIGGFVAAIVVAAINIGFSAFIGHFAWPYLYHKDSWKRVAATAASASWVLFIVVWNLLAAHFRDAKSGGLVKPEGAAITLLQNQPFTLDSIYSYGLLIGGLIFAILAAVTAFKMGDRYPGYGEIYQRHEARCDEYADLINEALEDLKATRDEGIKAARSVRDQLGIQFTERGQILAARQSHRERFNQYQDYLETIANTLFEHYRAANIRARTEPPPPHFAKRWELSRVELPLAEELSIEAEVIKAQAALDSSIKEITEAYEVAIRRFVHLDEIKRTLGDG